MEIVIWQLPEASSEGHHRLKYRLYFGNAGRCVVRYDNETGKGNHRYYRDAAESKYRFSSLGRLLADIREDCVRLAGWRVGMKAMEFMVLGPNVTPRTFGRTWRDVERGGE